MLIFLQLKDGSESRQSTPLSASPTSTDHEEEIGPPAEKRFKHLLELRIKEGIQKASTLTIPPGKVEIEHYSSVVTTLSDKDPIITCDRIWENPLVRGKNDC